VGPSSRCASLASDWRASSDIPVQFRGLQPLKGSKQIPEQNVAIPLSASAGSRVFLVPYLGKARELAAEHKGGRIRAVIPEIDKGSTAWIE
jgi:hypothetical protein